MLGSVALSYGSYVHLLIGVKIMGKKKSVKELRDAELLALKKQGRLKAATVVEYAKNPKTALHSAFEWDDGKAAHQYRLWQAEHLIISVRIIEPKSNTPIQAFVSLGSDRKQKGGGYRDTVSVLSDKQLREELLMQAWREFRYWQEKYQSLVELTPIFAAAESIKLSKVG
jgi:hypothetical protein